MLATVTCDEHDETFPTSGFADTDWTALWKQHGHYPGRVTMRCVCGAELKTGPKVTPDWQEALRLIKAWDELHGECTAS
jgi:hypothetical protein